MYWPYAFVDLNDAEKIKRRELLDWYGAFAQLSVVFPLLALQLYFFSSWLRTQWRNANEIETPSSPRVKEARGSMVSRARNARRVRWWMGEKVVLGGDVMGSRGEVLGAVVWLVWLLGLSFADTGRDYLHLTKRFGIVAASQLPFHYLLALKSPYSPLQYLVRSSHDSLNILHQLLGRIITILLYAHAALYLNFYIQKDLLASKLQEGYVICGIVGVWAFTIVGTTALAPVRKWSYRVFYAVHVTLASLLLPVLWFHVSHIRIYLYETAAVYAANVVLRNLNSKTVPASIRLLESGNLVEITIPLASAGAAAKKALHRYQPGQHAYISLPGHSASRTFRSNPFSLASIPSEDHELRFVARILDGNTAKLVSASKLLGATKQDITIEGPYGLATHAEELLKFDRILFVAGGVGGTFIASLYRQLLMDLSPSAGSYRRQKVNFAWIARSMEDVSWAIPREGKEREGFLERLQVYLTGSRVNGGFSGAAFGGSVRQAEEGIELEERKGLLGTDEVNGHLNAGEAKVQLHSGRPDLSLVVDQTFSHGISERVAVVVCGPRNLTSRLREEVGEKVQRGRVVWFWEESFAL